MWSLTPAVTIFVFNIFNALYTYVYTKKESQPKLAQPSLAKFGGLEGSSRFEHQVSLQSYLKPVSSWWFYPLSHSVQQVNTAKETKKKKKANKCLICPKSVDIIKTYNNIDCRVILFTLVCGSVLQIVWTSRFSGLIV